MSHRKFQCYDINYYNIELFSIVNTFCPLLESAIITPLQKVSELNGDMDPEDSTDFFV